MKDKPLYQEFLEKYNLEQVLDILVTDHKDSVIGMISIQFLYITEKNNTENLDHEAMKKIFIYKNRIEFILNKKRNKFSILSLWENMG